MLGMRTLWLPREQSGGSSACSSFSTPTAKRLKRPIPLLNRSMAAAFDSPRPPRATAARRLGKEVSEREAAIAGTAESVGVAMARLA